MWGLWELRPELRAVPYLDDSSLHQQMVRVAASRIRQGHLPLTSWFPYLGLGSPQYLHYQSLPSMVSGALGAVFDPDAVFRWSLYLLLALWPISVYWGGRLFGLGRWTAAAAAAVSPFLASAAGIGYETKAYVWVGYGVWTQLWAAWTLPLAWGFTYRALSSLRAALPAVLFVMLTVALHFETGYLAFVPLVVWPFLVPSDLWRRLGRALVVGVAALLASAWVIVPLLDQSHWAARNQVLGGTGLENGYGARQMLSWLFGGQIYDAGRWPVVTILVGVGLAVCVARWRTSVAGRALVSIWVVTLLMTFGRTTFGSLYRIVPGSSDIFIRRFQMGLQLSGILLAGIGVVFLGRLVLDAALRLFPEERRTWAAEPAGRGLVAAACIVALVIVLAPAWSALDSYDGHNATNIGLQAGADAQQDPQIDRLLAYVRAHPQGRVYAGLPTNWGQDFLVGAVPVFKYLESKNVDEVGYTLRTASLMTDPEYFFDESNPGDYPLFGIGYVITAGHDGAPGPGAAGRLLGHLLPVGPPPPRLHPRVRHDRRAHGHPGRRRLAEPGPARLPAPAPGARSDGGVQRTGGRGADGRGGRRAGGAAGAGADRARGPGERRRPRRGQDEPEGDGRPQRVLRPGLARHRERAPGAHGHGGTGAGRRRRRAGGAHRRLRLRRLRVVRPPVRAGDRRLRRPGAGAARVAARPEGLTYCR